MTDPAATNPVREFLSGAGVLLHGLRLWGTSPRLMLLGAIPALIVGAVVLTAIVALAIASPALIEMWTPFVDGWGETARTLVRGAAAVALVAVATIVLVYVFAALTLAVGDPFYEKIWLSVEARLGDAPPADDRPFWTAMARGIGDSLRLLVRAVGIGVLLFVGGLIPVVGQTVVPVLGAALGGWTIAIELTGRAFDARGHTLADRRRMLAQQRFRTLGFGVVAYLLLLVPVVAVIVMPAATAAATVLARGALERAAGGPKAVADPGLPGDTDVVRPGERA